MIPPPAFSLGTAISTVGVVERSRSITSMPQASKVPDTMFFTISPDKRASRPITTLWESLFFFTHWAKAAVSSTISFGVRLSPGRPPMVPRMPEIDFMSDKVLILFRVQR